MDPFETFRAIADQICVNAPMPDYRVQFFIDMGIDDENQFRSICEQRNESDWFKFIHRLRNGLPD